MDDKIIYNALCKKFDLPIFMQDWWMDQVCGAENWLPILAVDGAGEVEAAQVCFIYRKFGLKVIIPAPLTPFSGIWFRPVHQTFKNHAENQRILDLTAQMASKMPPVIFIIQQFHFSFDNWLTFKWSGFRQTTRYTYFLDDLSDLKKVQSNFKGSTRTAIKKAETSISVHSSEDPELIFEMVRSELATKGVRFPLGKNTFLSLDQALKAHQSRKIYFAEDYKGKKLAAVYVVWDKSTTYLLLTAVNREVQNSNALSYLIWKSIEEASERGHSFDFEGSSLQHIEPFFRSFGGERKAYFRISKAKNMFWDVLFFLTGKGL